MFSSTFLFFTCPSAFSSSSPHSPQSSFHPFYDFSQLPFSLSLSISFTPSLCCSSSSLSFSFSFSHSSFLSIFTSFTCTMFNERHLCLTHLFFASKIVVAITDLLNVFFSLSLSIILLFIKIFHCSLNTISMCRDFSCHCFHR